MTGQDTLDWFDDLHPPTLAQQLAYHAKHTPPAPPMPVLPRSFPPMTAEDFVTDNLGHFVV